MKITSRKGDWYDENGRKLTDQEKASIQADILEELNHDLKDSGFEGWIKRFVLRQIEKTSGKVHFSDEKTESSSKKEDTNFSGQEMADQAIETAIKGLELAIAELTEELEKLKEERDKLLDRLGK